MLIQGGSGSGKSLFSHYLVNKLLDQIPDDKSGGSVNGIRKVITED